MQAGPVEGRQAASDGRRPRGTVQSPATMRAIQRRRHCGEGHERFPGCRGWPAARMRRRWVCLWVPGDCWQCASGLSVGRSGTASVTGPTSLHRPRAFVGRFLRNLLEADGSVISFWNRSRKPSIDGWLQRLAPACIDARKVSTAKLTQAFLWACVWSVPVFNPRVTRRLASLTNRAWRTLTA